MKLLAVCTGKVSPLLFTSSHGEARSTPSAIKKNAVSTLENPTCVAVNRLGIEGDEQYDHQVHGGLYKAVYMMPAEHYPFWNALRAEKGLPHPLPWGFLGENLVCEGLLETEVRVGDEYEIGSALLRVTQPREPCYKFAVRMQYAAAVKHMVQRACSGWYLSVLQTGQIQAGATIHRRCVGDGPTIATRFAALTRNKQQMDLF